MAPGLVTREKAERGKTPTDVWWHTIVPTNGREKTGYPTQKPLGVIERIIKVHTEPGDVVLDFFAGSGTTGEAAAKNGRGFVLIDESREACQISAERLARFEPALVGFEVLTRSVAPLFASSSAPDRSAVPEPARSIPERDLETATEPSSSQPSAPGTALKP